VVVDLVLLVFAVPMDLLVVLEHMPPELYSLTATTSLLVPVDTLSVLVVTAIALVVVTLTHTTAAVQKDVLPLYNLMIMAQVV
tara:strand:+ start:1686 stop:1934 length:249 start_codon:yes stop_codon:yes gene_type:complete